MSPARAIGNATISFGLVSIPVKLYTTNESSSDISFNMLHDACGSRLKQQYVCTKDGEIVDSAHTLKGYEFTKDQYVMFTADELKALHAVATDTIDLVKFVPTSAIDPIWLEKSYYLGPDRGGDRAYGLLAEALRQADRVGIARYSARGKQYLLAVTAVDEGLIAYQLRYATEIKPWSEIPRPALPEVQPGELALARQLMAQFEGETLNLAAYQDEVKVKMLALIQAKISGGNEITAAPEMAPRGQLVDIMTALTASLKAGGVVPAALPPAASATEPAAVEPAAVTPPKRARAKRGAS